MEKISTKKQKKVDPEAMVSDSSLLSNKAAVVLDAARRVFLKYGFANATTDMIQQEANVSKSTVYVHYKNKEALFIAFVESECNTLIERVHAIQLQRLDLRESLKKIGRVYLDIILSPAGLALYRVVVSEAPRFPHLAIKFHESGPEAVTKIVTEVLERSVGCSYSRNQNSCPKTVANMFMHLVRSEPHMHSLMHPGSVYTSCQRDEWVLTIVDMLTNWLEDK